MAFSATAVVMLAALLGAAGAGGVAILSSDDANEVTITGTVTEFFYNPHWEVTSGFNLSSEGTIYHVEVGPPWYWNSSGQNITVTVGNTVTVHGELEEDGVTIEAWTITADSTQTIKGEGKPDWAGIRSELDL